MWFRYFSHILAGNDQASLHIRSLTSAFENVDDGLGQIV